jgi:hypothetical protein
MTENPHPAFSHGEREIPRNTIKTGATQAGFKA